MSFNIDPRQPFHDELGGGGAVDLAGMMMGTGNNGGGDATMMHHQPLLLPPHHHHQPYKALGEGHQPQPHHHHHNHSQHADTSNLPATAATAAPHSVPIPHASAGGAGGPTTADVDEPSAATAGKMGAPYDNDDDCESGGDDVAVSSKSLFFCMTFDSPFYLLKEKKNKLPAAQFHETRFQAKYSISKEDGEVLNQAVPDEAYSIESDLGLDEEDSHHNGESEGGGVRHRGVWEAHLGSGGEQHDHHDSYIAPSVVARRGNGEEEGEILGSGAGRFILEPVPFNEEGAFIMHDELLVLKPDDRVTENVTERSDRYADHPTRRLLRIGLNQTITVPNAFQKVIDIILRFRARGLHVRPHNMLGRAASPDDVPSEDGGVYNYYQGYYLVKRRCFASPDGDEISVKIHMPTPLMLQFAESRGLYLPTNAFSYAGGRSLMYSAAAEKELTKSVNDIQQRRGGEKGGQRGQGRGGGETASWWRRWGSGGKEGQSRRSLDSHDPKEPGYRYGSNEPGDDDPTVDVPLENQNWGFLVNVPIKQRILGRFIREPWRFGGCGIQVNEMMSRKILVKHFFPLHSTAQLMDKKLLDWASLKQIVSLHPMQQNNRNIMGYFGEEVSLYFYWIKRYTIALVSPAVVGVAMGIASETAPPQHKDVIKGAFAIFCVAWGAFWSMYWLRLEMMFVADHQLQDVDEQATLRDRYEGTERRISNQKLYHLDFQNPPAFLSKSDGTLVELYYPPWRRKLIRYGVSYPIILLLSAMMTALLCLNTYYRLEYTDDWVQYVCSIISVVISKLFDLVFSYVVETTSSWENNRTDEEEEYQNIIKRFFHYFLSSYFSLLSLLFWPADGTSDDVRMSAMESQMIISCIVMPLVQDVTETLLPVAKARFRINRDHNPNSLCTAIGRTIRGYGSKDYPRRCVSKEAEALWIEAQKQPLPSMADEYLEVAIQFGYMVMFAVAFPWAAVAAVVYNILEIRVDAFKITYFHQRPFAKPVKNIGAWRMIYGLLSVASIITNTFIISVMTEALVDTGLEIDTTARYQFFVGFQYVLVAVAGLVYVFTPITPDSLAKASVKQTILLTRHARNVNKERRVMQLRRRERMKEASHQQPQHNVATVGAPPRSHQRSDESEDEFLNDLLPHQQGRRSEDRRDGVINRRRGVSATAASQLEIEDDSAL